MCLVIPKLIYKRYYSGYCENHSMIITKDVLFKIALWLDDRLKTERFPWHSLLRFCEFKHIYAVAQGWELLQHKDEGKPLLNFLCGVCWHPTVSCAIKGSSLDNHNFVLYWPEPNPVSLCSLCSFMVMKGGKQLISTLQTHIKSSKIAWVLCTHNEPIADQLDCILYTKQHRLGKERGVNGNGSNKRKMWGPISQLLVIRSSQSLPMLINPVNH